MNGDNPSFSYFTVVKVNKYAIYAYTHGPVTGQIDSTQSLVTGAWWCVAS